MKNSAGYLHFIDLIQLKHFLKCLAAAILFIFLVSCENNSSQAPLGPSADVKPSSPQTAPGPTPTPEPKEAGCVQVFYDKSEEHGDLARSYALMILNLMGHFPHYQQIIGPMDRYKKGDLDKCKASFYIGLAKEAVLPKEFLKDYIATAKTVVWMGSNFWQLGQEFEKTFGYRNYEITGLDTINKTPAPGNKPSFFRDILYKGEVFSKYNVWLKDNSGQLDGSFEMIKLTEKTSASAITLAEARHSFSKELIPWALQAGRKFYIAEIPLSYFHEADRYFVFADLLFDFLEEKPRHNARNAFIRLEDIGPMEDLKYLQEAMDIFTRNKVTPHFNLYPVFMDPLDTEPSLNGAGVLRMEDAPTFSAAIQNHIKSGAVIIWHGVTHQYSNVKNPWTGASGDDYEFWDATANAPVAEDSIDLVLNKMEDGFKSLKAQNIEPKLWVIPHYEASALDNVIFGQLFSWMVSRGVYIDNMISGLKHDYDKPIGFSMAQSQKAAANRKEFFTGLTVKANSKIRFGQIFPYELYGDLYRQHVIPEDLGNVEPELTEQVEFTRTVDTILEDAKRNLVLRDVWASAFYHPFLLNPKMNKANQDPSKPKDLERLIKGLKALGYNFVNLEDWIKDKNEPLAKPRIELEELRP